MLLLVASAFAADSTLDLRASLSYWRLGVSVQARPGLTVALPNEKEGSLLFGDTWAKAELDLMATPAFARGGARLSVQPLAILEVGGFGQYDYYFGNFQTIIGYPTSDYDYGDNNAINTYADDTGNQSRGQGWHAGGYAVLKAKAGPVVVMINGETSYWNENGDVQGDWFFERDVELMMALGGDTYSTANGMLLYEKPLSDTILRVGGIGTWRHTWVADDTLARAGGLVQAVHGNWQTTLLVQPYITGRIQPSGPFTALQLKYSRVTP